MINKIDPAQNKVILIGIVLSAIFWIIEAAMHVYIFHDGTLLQQILSPEPHEAWMRLIVVGMFIAFSIYADSIINIRRRAEEATRQAYAELNQVLDTAADGMRLVDKDFNILRVNDTFSALSGIDKDEAIGRKCYEVFRGPLCHSPACPLTRIFQGEGRVECDVEKERSDGTTVPCILTATPFRLPSGKLVGIVEDFKDITERKKTEAALWESERQKQTILDASVDMIVQIDKEMRIVWASKTAGAILNEKPENLIGHTCHKVYQNSNTPCPDCPCKRALESGRIEHGIKYQPAMNVVGESYWEDYGVPLKNESGEVVGLIEIARNVTEKIKAEKALRESEEKLAGIVDSITDLMIMVDEHFNIIWANDLAADFCRTDPVGEKCYIVYHSGNETCASCIVKECFKDGEVHEFETEIVGPDEKQRVFWGTASVAAHYEDGRPMAVVEFLRDITYRKQAERDIKILKQQMEFILGATKTGLDIIDSQFNIRYIDPEWEKLYGDPAGRKCYEYFMGRSEICPGCGIPGALKTKAITVTEEILVREGNRPIQVTTIPFQDDKGEWLVAEVNVDITERKKAEEEKEKLETQLHQAQKMEAVGTLAGGIAHDFNNLLMSIQGRVSLMLMRTDHPHFEYLKELEDIVQGGAHLTKQLLGFARHGKYEVTPTDLNELIDKGSGMFGRTQKEIRIHRKLREGIWTTEVDAGQIEQAMLNLYVNAWQAMPEGGDLYLQTENVILDENHAQPFNVKSGRYVKISVTDTGVGMDKVTQQRIFEPFFTTKEIGRGTGLGLASTYGIIKNHGGIINVYSEIGHGTTFTIYLPASEKKIVKKQPASETLLSGNETVLLVDDEDMVIDISQQMLEALGYQVLSARSGHEALEIYAKHKDTIDVVVLDMIMPGMSGGVVYDRLKEINPDVRCLLASGYSMNGQATEILERGCSGFIQKPFNMEQLSQKVREVLDTLNSK